MPSGPQEGRKSEEVEMHGMVEKSVYKQMARPKNKLVVGTEFLYKITIEQDGEVETYKYRVVDHGFWQIGEGTIRTSTHPPHRPRQSGCFLATAAPEDGEMRHSDAEQEFLKADIDEGIYIEIPEESLDFPGTGGLLEAVYWLVQVEY